MDFVWSVLLLVGMIAAGALGAFIFVPPLVEDWEEKRGLAVIKAIRTAVAVIATIFFAIQYGAKFTAEQTVLNFAAGKFGGGALAMALIGLLLWMGFVVTAGRTERRELFKRSIFNGEKGFIGFLPTLIGYVICSFGGLLCMVLLFDKLENGARTSGVILKLLLGLLSLVVLLVGMLAFVILALLAMESSFNAGVTHPYLAPVMGLAFMLTVTYGGSGLFALLPFLNSPIADPTTSWAEQGSFETVVKWAATLWAIAIAAVEVLKARHDDNLDWRGVPREHDDIPPSRSTGAPAARI